MKWLTSLVLSLACLTANAQSAGGPRVSRSTQGVEGALPIAIVPFEWAGAPMPTDIAQVVSNDLTRSGRFNPMPRNDLPSKPSDPTQVNLKEWRAVGMDNLVIGRITASGDGGYVKTAAASSSG